MQKEKIKALRKSMKSVGKFAPQPGESLQSNLMPIQIDPCREQQTALNGALTDVDSAIAALDAALLIVAERLEALDACRLSAQA